MKGVSQTQKEGLVSRKSQGRTPRGLCRPLVSLPVPRAMWCTDLLTWICSDSAQNFLAVDPALQQEVDFLSFIHLFKRVSVDFVSRARDPQPPSS
jgi:hypothetical protein